MVERYHDLVASLKAIPLILTYEKHDYVTAAISHLPHIIASSLVNLVKDCDYEDGTMKKVAAGSLLPEVLKILHESHLLLRRCGNRSVLPTVKIFFPC